MILVGNMVECLRGKDIDFNAITFYGGGVSRLKKHLAGGKGAGYSEVIGCLSVSYDVKIAIAQHSRQIRAEKRTHS
ncbi:hypothetical protein Taro_051477, partial [Colocasia esculenta]|nr:hypothetical protein [Colocasia esculenta]